MSLYQNVYNQRLSLGDSKNKSKFCAKWISLGNSMDLIEIYSTAYDKMISQGKDDVWAHSYADCIANGKNNIEAMIHAQINMMRRNSLLLNDNIKYIM